MNPQKRRRVIAGNWKMYKTQADTRAFFAVFNPLVAGIADCDIVIAPPFTSIPAAVEATKATKIGISAQNVYWEKEGAFTGEVSAAMLVEGGCRYTIILIAYEPIWAIGTGRTATPEIAAAVHKFVRQRAAEQFSASHASGLRILYGGSVKPDNIQGLMAQEELDGVLVGGASLEAKSFASIVKDWPR